MASFFGEVVFPVSRAFWDEEDENEATEQSVKQPEFFIRWLKEKPDSIDTLVIVEGEMLIDFSRDCLCQHLEEACFVEDDSAKKLCSIYLVNDNVCLCIIAPKFDVKFSGKFINTMADIISKTKRIICITNRHISQFKSKNTPSESSFLRMLFTQKGENICKLKVPLLEQPNIVYGVAAGALSYAEFMDASAVLYVLYTDSFALDSLTAEPLLKLFKAMNCTLHDVNFAGKDFFNKGNLYM